MHGDFWALLTKNAVLLRRLREEVLKSRSEKPQYGKKCSNAADMDSSESIEGAGRAVARLGRGGAAGRNGGAAGSRRRSGTQRRRSRTKRWCDDVVARQARRRGRSQRRRNGAKRWCDDVAAGRGGGAAGHRRNVCPSPVTSHLDRAATAALRGVPRAATGRSCRRPS